VVWCGILIYPNYCNAHDTDGPPIHLMILYISLCKMQNIHFRSGGPVGSGAVV